MQVSCAFCDGVLEAVAEDLGQQISCPHCTLDFELTAALIAEEETAAGSVIGSWFNGSLSTIISAAIHTVILVLCALYVLPQQVNESVGNEVALEGLPIQQTLTTSTEPEQLETEPTEAESDSESLSELEVEIVSTTDSSDGSGDLEIEALTTSDGQTVTFAIEGHDGTTSASAARSGDKDAFSFRAPKGGKAVNRGKFIATAPPKANVQKQVLARLGVCGYGFGWKKVPGGYICKANICRITDAQFDAQYERMYPGTP